MKELLGKTLGNYLLQRILGRGRMGVVFLAQDRALLRPTALKLLAWSMENESTEDPVKWFLSEARSVARISHPNVIQIYNIAKHCGHRYIAMEYVEGVSVEQKLLKKGRFSVERATDLLVQTSAALEAAHRCGVIHRDIKPANILLRTDGIVKLSDFGMALSDYRDTLLNAAMRVGTPYFNAPETWEGRPASPASDIYALGVTYFLLLTGRLPYEAKNMHELQWKHIHAPIPDPRAYVPGLPGYCKEITDACLQKRPHCRCSDAKEIGAAARALLASLKQKPATVSNPTTISSTPPDSIVKPGYESASEQWSTALAFSIDPFSAVDPLSVPYDGEPFASALDAANQALEERKSVVMIHGIEGSGRTTLCRRQIMQHQSRRLSISLNADQNSETFAPIAELCRYAGLDPEKPDALETLAGWLGRKDGSGHEATTIYLDTFPENSVVMGRIVKLTKLVSKIESCTLVIVSSTEAAGDLASALSGIEVINVHVRTLEPREVIEYMRAWVKKALLPVAPLLLMTTDACLLAAHISSGNLAVVNRLARHVLRLSARSGRKVVSSWEMWNCRDLMNAPAASPENLPERPPNWPSEEVAAILDEYRIRAGLPPVSRVTKAAVGNAMEKEKQDE